MDKTEKRNALIEQWFREQFHREPIATNTQHFNYVRGAVEDLKALLAKED